MMARLHLVVVIAACIITAAHSYFIHIDASSEECFFETATTGTKMTITFEVSEGGFLDIDVNVSLPTK